MVPVTMKQKRGGEGFISPHPRQMQPAKGVPES